MPTVHLPSVTSVQAPANTATPANIATPTGKDATARIPARASGDSKYITVSRKPGVLEDAGYPNRLDGNRWTLNVGILGSGEGTDVVVEQDFDAGILHVRHNAAHTLKNVADAIEDVTDAQFLATVTAGDGSQTVRSPENGAKASVKIPAKDSPSTDFMTLTFSAFGAAANDWLVVVRPHATENAMVVTVTMDRVSKFLDIQVVETSTLADVKDELDKLTDPPFAITTSGTQTEIVTQEYRANFDGGADHFDIESRFTGGVEDKSQALCFAANNRTNVMFSVGTAPTNTEIAQALIYQPTSRILFMVPPGLYLSARSFDGTADTCSVENYGETFPQFIQGEHA